MNNFNKREHYIENLITTEQITVGIAGHVIGIYVFLCIVALDNLFDNDLKASSKTGHERDNYENNQTPS